MGGMFRRSASRLGNTEPGLGQGMMTLPVMPPVAPMLARLERDIPQGGDFFYEPKWDGFRCIAFRDGEQIELTSRNALPLTRYFPELVAAMRTGLPPRCVVDGEIVITSSAGLDFDALLQRIHPASSRVRMLAERTPASFVAFDLLALGEEDMRSRPFALRREHLMAALGHVEPPLHVTPGTIDPAVAHRWFDLFEGAGLDGIVVKPLDLPYLPGERAMIKVKHERTADCVVAGYRMHKDGQGVGSLLLGLYDDQHRLHHVGVASGMAATLRSELRDQLEPLRADLGEHPWLAETALVRKPGGPSRWTGTRDLHWIPVQPERVVEVRYDHLQGDRFRHATRFLRWRPDRDPTSCTYSQLASALPAKLAQILAPHQADSGS